MSVPKIAGPPVPSLVTLKLAGVAPVKLMSNESLPPGFPGLPPEQPLHVTAYEKVKLPPVCIVPAVVLASENALEAAPLFLIFEMLIVGEPLILKSNASPDPVFVNTALLNSVTTKCTVFAPFCVTSTCPNGDDPQDELQFEIVN
jgi:hypothetical protein